MLIIYCCFAVCRDIGEWAQAYVLRTYSGSGQYDTDTACNMTLVQKPSERWYFFCLHFFSHFYFPASGQAVITGVVPSPPPVLAFNFYRA